MINFFQKIVTHAIQSFYHQKSFYHFKNVRGPVKPFEAGGLITDDNIYHSGANIEIVG